MDSQYYQTQPVQSQQQYYQDYPVSTDEIYAGEMQKQIVRNIVDQINPDKMRFEIEQIMRGKKFNHTNQIWEQRKTTTNEQELLVDDFMGYLSSIVNQNTPISNFSDNEINKIMQQSINWISDALEDEKYNITSYTERSRIGHILLNCMFGVLKRGLFGQESKRMWKSIGISETGGMGQPEQKKSMWDALKFWK